MLDVTEETPVSAPSARGGCVTRNGIFEGPLGPVDELEIRWSGRDAIGPPEARGGVEANVLWDVQFAGDRLWLRITPRAGEPLDRLTLGLSQGLLVRSVDRPGAADATVREVPSGTIWTMPLTPPLATGQSLTVELWGPLEAGADRLVRRLPRIEPLGLSECGGLVGVRRPEAWVGRVGPADGGEPVPDDRFARAWGPFPDATATFAGAARFDGVAELVLRAGPSRERPRVRPSVALEIAPGRIDVRAEAELTDESGAPRELEATIPPDLRLARVEAPGLTDWSRPADDRIRLRFDGDPAPMPRTIRVAGWIPVDADPMAAGASRSEADVPWPSWIASEVVSGALEITAPSHVTLRLDGPPSVRPTVSPAALPGTSRLTFSVPSAVTPGRLRWTAEPPGVTVRVQSLMTLHPASADWTASARYAVSWGPCPPIKLRLPKEWADHATAEIDGVPVIPRVEGQGGGVTWTLRPEGPAWGGARVVIHATRPRTTSVALTFPDLVPLGRPQLDRADSYLAYADASGLETVVERSAELQPVESSRWDGDELSWPPATACKVFRVLKEGWSLRFLAPAPRRDHADGAGVALAELECTLDADGDLFGRACYVLDDRPAATLFLTLPAGAELLAASVDDAAVAPRRDRFNRVLIPLPDGKPGRVVLCWRGKGDASRGGVLPLPGLPNQSVPTTLSVSAPERSRFSTAGKTVPIHEGDRSALRLDVQSRLLAERLGSFDRDSTRDRSALIAALIRIELLTRATLRSASPAPLDLPGSGRRVLEDALATWKLDEFAQSAAARVGKTETDPLASQPAASEPPASLRLRPIGATFTFRNDAGSPVVQWSLSPPSRDPLKPWWPAAATAGLALLGCAFGPSRPRRTWTALLLAAGIAATGLLALPASLVAGAILR